MPQQCSSGFLKTPNAGNCRVGFSPPLHSGGLKSTLLICPQLEAPAKGANKPIILPSFSRFSQPGFRILPPPPASRHKPQKLHLGSVKTFCYSFPHRSHGRGLEPIGDVPG